MTDALDAALQEFDSDYKINLDAYCGPLDLLLHLIKKTEVDIYDIPISKIADEYLQFVRMMKSINIDLAGEFLLMAATLMEIKSRMLLPAPEVEAGEVIDPRSELVHQLLEYKKYKDASLLLERLEDDHAQKFQRLAADKIEGDTQAEEDAALHEVTLWDLMEAFGKVLQEIALNVPREIIYTDVPISKLMTEVIERLRLRPVAVFTEFFTDARDRGRIIGIFLSILELVKQGLIRAEQYSEGGEIRLLLVEGSELDASRFNSEFDRPPAELLEQQAAQDNELVADTDAQDQTSPGGEDSFSETLDEDEDFS